MFQLTLSILTLLLLFGLGSTAPGKVDPHGYFDSPWEDDPRLPKNSRDWTMEHYRIAMQKPPPAFDINDWNRWMNNDPWEREMFHKGQARRDLSSQTPGCASAWAEEAAGTDMASARSAGQITQTGLKSGPEDGYGYYNGGQTLQSYPVGGSVFQHPNSAQFNRLQTTNTWPNYNYGNYYRSLAPSQAYSQSYSPAQVLPELGRSGQRLSANDVAPTYQYQQYRSNMHPVQTLPEVIETPSPKANQYEFAYGSPAAAAQPDFYASNYRSSEPAQTKPPAAVEDNAMKTNSQQYNNNYADLYRDQIQQAINEGKQLVAGIPNQQVIQHLNQQLSATTSDKLAFQGQVAPLAPTPTFPVTGLTFDPEEMKKVYGPYYVPPVFNLVQRQPTAVEGSPNPVVREVLQYLLNQYQSPNYVNYNGYRNQRLLPDISTQHQKMLHGFTPLQKLPRQSTSSGNQLLPPNVYRTEKWEPKTNLVVEDPVNLGEFQQSNYGNQMGGLYGYQMGQYPARSTPCSRHKRQAQDIWGYYPNLAPVGPGMTEPMGAFPGQKPIHNEASTYGQEEMPMGRTALPGLPGLPGLQGTFRQPTGGLGQEPYGQPYGGHPYPDYNSNYKARNAVQGLQQLISGFTQLMPMLAGGGLMNGLPQLKK